MNKLVATLACLGTLTLAACGSSTDGSQPDTSNQNDNSNFQIRHVQVGDRTVTCLWDDNNGSISCDWANAK